MNKPFEFEKEDIVKYMVFEMDLIEKTTDSIESIKNRLNILGNKLLITDLDNIDLGSVEWYESKNYNWLVVEYGNISFLIRQYGGHFTISIKKTETKYSDIIEREHTKVENGLITFYTDTKHMSGFESDKRVDNPFIDLNNAFKGLIETINKYRIGMLWNSSAFKRPEFCEVKLGFTDYNTIHSIDLMIFAMEELSIFQQELFAQNEVYNLLFKLKVGDKIGNDEILKIHTDLKDGYYHGVGITFNDGSYMKDVYFLTHWLIEDIYPLIYNIKE